MALKIYRVNVGGIEHTMQLSEADAKRYGSQATAVAGAAARSGTKSAGAPANKSRTPRNKAAVKKAAEGSAAAAAAGESADDSDW